MSRRSALVYGAAALRACASGDRLIWSLHRAALRNGLVPMVAVGALADAIRTQQQGSLLDELVRGCEVEHLDGDGAASIGGLAKSAETADLVAVSTARLAAAHNAAVVSNRQSALKSVADQLKHELVLFAL